MSLSKYKSQKETANLGRLLQIILGPCADTLRAILRKNVSPQDLKQKVNIFVAHRKKSQITIEQKQLVDSGKYSDFDITLLYVLLRNISGIPQHTNGWGNDPSPTDRSVSANVERIRLIRNKYYGHATHCSILDSEFEHIWKDIFQIVQDLEQYLGKSTVYQDVIIDMKYPDADSEEVVALQQRFENIKDILPPPQQGHRRPHSSTSNGTSTHLL